MNSLKKDLKNNREVLEKVLTFYGATITVKGNCHCIPSRHHNPKNDLSIKKKDGYVCCCHCGLKGDVFNVVKIIEDITSFPDQIKRICEIIGLDYHQEINKYCNNNEKNKNDYNFAEIVNDLHNNINKTDYFKKRGLTFTIDKYKLGYHPDGLNYIINKYPEALEEKQSLLYSSYQYFIPFIDDSGKYDYILPRRNDSIPKPKWANSNNIKVHNLKGYSNRIFNVRYLKNKDLTGSYIFLTEGWADALSIEELGYHAISLNGVFNYNKFIKELKKNRHNLTEKTFILVGDNDKSGNQLNKRLEKILKTEEVNYYIFKLSKYHDINDWLVNNKSELHDNIKKFLNIKSSYLSYNSNSKNSILHVEKYISDNKAAVSSIIDSISFNNKILISGAMGIGKTHFIRTDLFNYARTIGKKIVLVIPGISQLENLKKNKGLPIVYADSEYNQTEIVAVTPDSLLQKVICKLPPNTYFLVVDEAHQKILDSNYRKAFKNIDIAEKTAYKIIYISATPRVLKNEIFDDILEITTANPIKSKIIIEPIDSRRNMPLSDVKLSIIKENLKKYDNIVFFQDNKKLNRDMANVLEKDENITQTICNDAYEYSIFNCQNEYNTEETALKSATRTQTIESGKVNKETREGLLTKKVSFATSVITAGIDLRFPNGNDALLIIDATESFDIDSIIQLIGRFRDGITVIILTRSQKSKGKMNLCYSFENILDTRLNSCKKIESVYNENKLNIEYYKEDVLTNSLLYDEENKLYKVDKSSIAEKAYRIWNNLLMYDVDKLINLLQEQKAFEVFEEIEVHNWIEEVAQVNVKLKDLKKVRNNDFNKVKEKMLEFDNKTLLAILTKNFDVLNKNEADITEAYYYLRPKSHEDKLLQTGKLFIDKGQAVDLVKSFKHFYSNSWSSIKNEIDRETAKLINEDFKKNGIEAFLDIKLYNIRTQQRQQQAKIRYELKDLEQKQGRLSNKLLNTITERMIREGYYRNENTSIFLNENLKINERNEAFKSIRQCVLSLIKLTYNITKDKRISSANQ